MLSSSRTFLLALLIVLQFFAPLLHAHAGLPNAHFGLHIPGLESLAKTRVDVSAEKIEIHVGYIGDSVIVAIDEGMREQRYKILEASDSDAALPKPPFRHGTTPASRPLQSHLKTPIFVRRLSALPLAPRAPPAI